MDIIADRVERVACSKCGHHIDLSGMEPFSEAVCPSCTAKQVVPMRLGTFLLIRELGKGGMGAVYRAYDQTLGRYVAIKVMQQSLGDDKQFSQNFLREARAAAALNHPHVAQIYSCGTEKGQLYIVMELVDGGGLDASISGGRAMDEIAALELGVQVAEGLQAANDIGLVHGDIKPANILFDRQNRSKVVDFGLARFERQKHEPGEIWGTPYYIAPEKVRSQPEDLRSDIYSLGATLFHALAGEPPFEGETAKDVVIARLKGAAPDLRTVRPELQPETAATIARMLEAEPSKRYPTYPSLLADMRNALRIARLNPGRKPVPRTSSASKTPVIVAALVGLVLLGGLIWIMRSGEEAPPPRPVRPQVVTPSTPDQPPTTQPSIEYRVQPFNDAQQARIAQAAEHWANGRIPQAENTLQGLFNDLPQVGLERPWVGVLQAMPAWMEGNEADRNRFLRGIHNARLRELPDDERHPGAMPQMLARFMIEQVDRTALEEEIAHWPAWYTDLALFVSGIQHLRQRAIQEGLTDLRRYAEAEPANDVKWPYSFQPAARAWLQQFEEWAVLVREAKEMPPDVAVRTLTQFRNKTLAVIRPLAQSEIQRAQRLFNEQQQQQAADTSREALKQRIEEDYARVEALRTQNASRLAERDFSGAREAARALRPQLKTGEGRVPLDILLERYQRMDTLRTHIVQGINEQPVTQRTIPDLGGDAIRASPTAGIQVRGRQGTLTLEWPQISDRVMALLGDYYVAVWQVDDEKKADMLLNIAVYAYENRGMRPAQIYAERAVELKPDLQGEIDRLMPDLLREGE